MGARAHEAKDVEDPSSENLGTEPFKKLETEAITSPDPKFENSFSKQNTHLNISSNNIINIDNDQEEGEIVDDFEEIISSDEELVIGRRIKELERQNAELGKIEKTSINHNYDYYKSNLAINLVSDSDNEYLEYPYYDRIGPIKYPQKSHQFSSYQLNKKSENKRTKKSKVKNKYSNRQNEHENEEYSSSRRHRRHKSRRKSFPLPKRNSLSASPSLTHRSKRKYEQNDCNSPSSITLSSSDEENSEVNKLNRDQLRLALNGGSKKPRRGNFKNFRKKLKTEQNKNTKVENQDRNIDTIKEEESDDSVTLEEQELRIIALKSAVVQNHLKRKQRRDNEKPYSPSDFVDQIIQNIPSPKTIGNSPVASPIEDEDILLSEDMEIVNSGSDTNDNPIFLGGDTFNEDCFHPTIQQNLDDMPYIENISDMPKVLRAASDDENSKLRIISSTRSPDPNDEEECALRTLLLSQKKITIENIESKKEINQRENYSQNRIGSNITPPNLSEADICDLRDMILENMKTINNRTNSVLKEAVKRLKRERRKSDEPENCLPQNDEFENYAPSEIPENINQMLIEDALEYSQNQMQPSVAENLQYTKNSSQNINFKSNLMNSTNYLVPDQNLLPVSTFYPDWDIFSQNPNIPPVNQIQYPCISPNLLKPVEIERSALKVIPLLHQNDPTEVLSNKNSNVKEINNDYLRLSPNLESPKTDSKTNKNDILRSRLNELENEIEDVDIILEKRNTLEINSFDSRENESIPENISQIEVQENTSCALNNKTNFSLKSLAEQSLKLLHNRPLENNIETRNMNAPKTVIQQTEVIKKIDNLQSLNNTIVDTSTLKVVPNLPPDNRLKSHKTVKSAQKLSNLPIQSGLKRKTGITNQTTNKCLKVNETAIKSLRVNEPSKIELSKKFAPSCPKVQKLIININASSETDSDNFELNESNYTNNHSYDDNASPMSFLMDSPCYSPLNLPSKLDKNLEAGNKNNESTQKSNVGVGKSVVNDLFEAKLNEFLKTARTNVDKTKQVDLPARKIISSSLKPSLAVCHLPKSSQDEYNKLILRMKLLEKQRFLKMQEKQKIVEDNTIHPDSTLPLTNLKVTITNNALSSCNLRNSIKNSKTKLSDNGENTTITKTIVNEVALLSCSQNQDSTISLLTNSDKNDLDELEDNNRETRSCKNLIHSNEYELNQSQNITKNFIPRSAEEIILTPDLVAEKEKKADLLERYEEAYEKNGSNILSNLNKAIDLINIGQQEKIKKNQLQLHLESLRKECEKIEDKIQMQNKKISKIYPEISNSHRIIGDLKVRRLKLTTAAKNLGRVVKGETYSLKDVRKLDIYNKFKEFSNGIEILKSLNINAKKKKLANISEVNVKPLNEIDQSSEPNVEQSDNNLAKSTTNSNLLLNESIANTTEHPNFNTETDIKKKIVENNVQNSCDENTSKSKVDTNIEITSTELTKEIKSNEIEIQYSVDCLILQQDPAYKKIFIFKDYYASPLEYNKSHFHIDSNAILCPYQLKGLCDDIECKFQHL